MKFEILRLDEKAPQLTQQTQQAVKAAAKPPIPPSNRAKNVATLKNIPVQVRDSPDVFSRHVAVTSSPPDEDKSSVIESSKVTAVGAKRSREDNNATETQILQESPAKLAQVEVVVDVKAASPVKSEKKAAGCIRVIPPLKESTVVEVC